MVARNWGRSSPGQGGDHIHVDVRKAGLPGQREGAQRVLRGVRAADAPQGFIRKRLRVDAHALYPALADGAQFLHRDGIRPARFHRPLPRAGEGRLRLVEHARELRGG